MLLCIICIGERNFWQLNALQKIGLSSLKFLKVFTYCSVMPRWPGKHSSNGFTLHKIAFNK